LTVVVIADRCNFVNGGAKVYHLAGG